MQGDWHALADGEPAFEDGTVNYLSLPAVEQGLRYLEGIGIDTIHTRVRCLTAWLLEELAALRHANGSPVVQIHGPRTTHRRGGTIAFNFLRPDGRLVDVQIVDSRAAEHARLAAHGLLLQPGLGRAGLRHPARGTPSSNRLAVVQRPPPSSGNRERRRGSRLARRGDDVPRRLPLHALRVDVRASDNRLIGLKPAWTTPTR